MQTDNPNRRNSPGNPLLAFLIGFLPSALWFGTPWLPISGEFAKTLPGLICLVAVICCAKVGFMLAPQKPGSAILIGIAFFILNALVVLGGCHFWTR